jgi:hypothetical protein
LKENIRLFAENKSLMNKISYFYEKQKQCKDSDEKEHKILLQTSFILELADKYNKRLNSKIILKDDGFHKPVIIPEGSSEGSEGIVSGILRPKPSPRTPKFEVVKMPIKLTLSLDKLQSSSDQKSKQENKDELSSPDVSPIKPLSSPQNNLQSTPKNTAQTVQRKK